MARLHWLESTLDLAFPACCAACGRATTDQPLKARGFCTECLHELPLFEDDACLRCATPLHRPRPALDQSNSGETECPACRDERWAFDETVALGAYEGLLRHLVLLAKRPAGAMAASALGKLLATREAQRLARLEPTAVVGVPTHWTRRFARRADGVQQLSESLARGCGLPLWKSLRRQKATLHQTSVAPSDRSGNVRGAFSLRATNRLSGKTVLLVDDVLTTGATCHAAAKALKGAGAGRVVAVVAARRVARL